MNYKPSVYMGRNNLIELWGALGLFFLLSGYAYMLISIMDPEDCYTSTNLKPGISAEECYATSRTGESILYLFAIVPAPVAVIVGLYYSKRAYIKCD